jgi:protease IV
MAKNSFWHNLKKEIRTIGRETNEQWHRLNMGIRNWQRRRNRLGYVVMPIGGPLPERSAPPRSFLQRQLPLPPDPLSLQQLNYRFHLLADADNVRGVVLLLDGLSAGLATLQNLRRSIMRLREEGKEVVVYTPYLDNAHYFVATAASRIIVPPGVEFEVLGLRTEAMFFKSALEKLGVSFANIQISPYKSAFDMFDKDEMSPELHQQLSWLLDERFNLLVEGMAEGRDLSTAVIHHALDSAPFSADDALRLHLIDAIGYEDEIAYLLADDTNGAADMDDEDEDEDEDDEAEVEANHTNGHAHRRKVRLTRWGTAVKKLTRRYRHVHPQKYIGVISLEGLITMGESAQPPVDLPIPFFGGNTAGEATITQLLRQAEQDEELAALILHVDSGGGSALASDLIWREVDRVRQKRPVLVYMGNSAASGGYYVAAPANHIMAQTGTITGSIGVVMGRPSTSGLYDKIGIKRVALQRGARAHLYTDDQPLNDADREIFLQGIMRAYEQFKLVVAHGRGIPYDELDRICLGRVWTGRQAKVYKLVDSHGDFVDAIHQAAQLAGLRFDDKQVVPVYNLYPDGGSYQLPYPYEPAEALRQLLTAEWLRHLQGPLYLLPIIFRDR